ncbi:MAG: hypothetical protein J6R86_04635, partial [Lentisphaeria bacterium]|nr:hypothetical protein [Lentisphaeria bacterium]
PVAQEEPAKKFKAVDTGVAKASPVYTVLAVATLLFAIAGAVITASHYVKFDHKLDYTHLLPGLPK